jgi:hypothetical protein
MLLGMGWERRLREMVLAGGALSATACGGSTEAPVDAASHELSNRDAVASGDDATSSGLTLCCNADPDPCCTCAGEITDADPASACGQELACQAVGGTWEPFVIRKGAPDGGEVLPHCEFEASEADGGPVDAAPVDAADACAPSGCTGSCLDLSTHNVSTVVNGCTVWQCCVPDDAGPEAATDAPADAMPDACAPSGGCTAACVAGRHNVTVMVDGCLVTECCVPDDAGTD